MEIAVAMHQDQGKREYQQDAMSIKPFGSLGVLAILADGMGGYEGGEIASKLVSENFREFSIEGEDIGASLKKYLLKGNEAIKAYKEDHPNVKSMGTTAIAFFMTDKNCQWVSVGDSPLYIIRNRSTISRINENHSVAGLLDLQVKKGEITHEEALSSGQRHMLTSAISGDDIPQIDTSVSWSIRDNDIFILASDGIETISEDRIREIVIGHTASGVTQENVQSACEALVDDVLAQGTKNQDNVTVIILAKMNDNEPKTAIYRGSSLDFNKKKKLPMAIMGGAAALIIILASIWLFFSDGEKKKTPVTVDTVENSPKPHSPQTKSKKPKSIPKAPSGKSALASTNADQNKTPVVTEIDQNKTKKSEKTVSHSEPKKTNMKNEDKATNVQKTPNKKEQKNEKPLLKTKEVSKKEIQKRNEELEKSGGV
jgi:protein phosphatase